MEVELGNSAYTVKSDKLIVLKIFVETDYTEFFVILLYKLDIFNFTMLLS